jgi:hypothetical protein
MKKLLGLVVVIAFAQLSGGCGIFGGGKTYDGSETYSQAHPEQSQPMPYMDPDSGYRSDNK